MDESQIRLLFEAAKTPLLTNEQRSQLQVRNPFEFKSPVADILQSEVSRLNPEQARKWIEESGARMSLAAAAVQHGLMEPTPALQAEVERFNPTTQAEQNAQRIEWLKAQNPFGKPGEYLPDGSYQNPVSPNLTFAMELENLAPEVAAELRAKATPAPLTQEQVFEQRQAQAAAKSEAHLRSMQHAHSFKGF